MNKAYSPSILYAAYLEAKKECQEWLDEGKEISDYILPGRGLFLTLTKPRKRKLTSPKVINPIAREALQVLTSGMQGGLTSPSRPWFKLQFTEPKFNKNHQFRLWLEECEKRLYTSLAVSNFYQVVHSFYTEFGGFGNARMYVGEDTKKDSIPFRFEILTFGEYVYTLNAQGFADKFFRIMFKSAIQLEELFGKSVLPDTVKRILEDKIQASTTYYTLLQAIVPARGKDYLYRSYYFLVGVTQDGGVRQQETFLKTSKYYEFPYPGARWEVIGSDVMGIGPGAESLPDVKRLQEMERAFLLAAHKDVNPPLQAPTRMKDRLRSLPGQVSYYPGPNEQVKKLYEGKFDYQGCMQAIEAVVQRIQRTFFNDIFLTASRDPNASPMKAAEVYVKDQEKMLRMGPVIERLYYEFLNPMLSRCFNILDRKGLLPPFPQMSEAPTDYRIVLVSPLAQAQKAIAAQSIQGFLGFTASAAQFDPAVLDNIDSDEAVKQYHDITGAPESILRGPQAVQTIRENRARVQQAQQEKEEAAAAVQIGSQAQREEAETRKASAEAGQIATETLTQDILG